MVFGDPYHWYYSCWFLTASFTTPWSIRQQRYIWKNASFLSNKRENLNIKVWHVFFCLPVRIGNAYESHCEISPLSITLESSPEKCNLAGISHFVRELGLCSAAFPPVRAVSSQARSELFVLVMNGRHIEAQPAASSPLGVGRGPNSARLTGTPTCEQKDPRASLLGSRKVRACAPQTPHLLVWGLE